MTKRTNLLDTKGENYTSANYTQPTFLAMEYAAHGGEDVAIWATGPYSHLFTGTIDNTFVARAIVFIQCLDDDRNACTAKNNGRSVRTTAVAMLIMSMIVIVLEKIL